MRSPISFFENRQKYPDCSYLCVKFLIYNTVLIVISSQICPCCAFLLCVVDEMFIGVPVFQKMVYNFIPLFPPLPEKFMIAPLFSYNSTTFSFHNTKPLLALSLVTT